MQLRRTFRKTESRWHEGPFLSNDHSSVRVHFTLYHFGAKRSCRRMGVPGYPVLIQSRRSDPVWRMQAARREASFSPSATATTVFCGRFMLISLVSSSSPDDRPCLFLSENNLATDHPFRSRPDKNPALAYRLDQSSQSNA